MNIYAYKGAIANLGDNLNHWLWPRVLSPSFLKRKGTLLGIGSVLHEDHLSKFPSFPLYVLGAGFRTEQKVDWPPELELRPLMVRGPLSARHFEENLFQADGALALALTEFYDETIHSPKEFEYTYIPYFRSGGLVNYQALERKLGVHVLRTDHYSNIEDALRTIAKSKAVISESLHGAILADVFRVPWQRAVYFQQLPFEREVATYKWKDWTLGMQLASAEPLLLPFPFSGKYGRRWSRLLRPYRQYHFQKHFSTQGPFQLSEEKVFAEKVRGIRSLIQNKLT